MRTALSACFLLIVASTPISAETLEFTCSFPMRATDEGVSKQDFEMTFVVDTISGEAFLRGNNGVAAVAVLRGESATTFVERLASGAIQTTTVTDAGEAVHSRHTIIAGSVLSPSQNYGSCRW